MSLPYNVATSFFQKNVPPGLRDVELELSQIPTGLESPGGLIRPFFFQPRDFGHLVLGFQGAMPIRMADFHGLKKCIHLSTLVIRSDIAASLDDEDIAELANALPCLTVLLICPDPIVTSTPPLCTLAPLNSIVSHCRAIQEVSLYINARRSGTSGNPQNYELFSPTVKLLHFGLSKVHNSHTVAIFLTWMTKYCPTLKIAAGFSLRRTKLGQFATSVSREAVTQWGSVDEQVSHLRAFVQAVEASLLGKVCQLEERVAEMESHIAEFDAQLSDESEPDSGSENDDDESRFKEKGVKMEDTDE